MDQSGPKLGAACAGRDTLCLHSGGAWLSGESSPISAEVPAGVLPLLGGV